jgi:hypothetical protein
MRRILSSVGFALALLCLRPPTRSRRWATVLGGVVQNLCVRDAEHLLLLGTSSCPRPRPSIPRRTTRPRRISRLRYRPIDNSYSYVTSAAANDAFIATAR